MATKRKAGTATKSPRRRTKKPDAPPADGLLPDKAPPGSGAAFVADPKVLLNAIQRVIGATAKKSTMPILSHVRLEVVEKGARLLVAATDLEVTIQAEVALKKAVRKGVLVLLARDLEGILKRCKADEVRFLGLENHFAEVDFGRSHFEVVGMLPDAFPVVNVALEKGDLHPIDPGALREALERVSPAMSKDETRYNICGILVEDVKGSAGVQHPGIRLVATDGNRLCMTEHRWKGAPAITGKRSRDVILHRKTVKEALSLLGGSGGGDAHLGVDERAFVLSRGGVTLRGQLVEGEFPSYRQVIPSQSHTRVTVEADVLLEAIGRTSVLLASNKESGIMLTLSESGITLYGRSLDRGEATEELEVVAFDGPGLKVGTSSVYLTDAVASVRARELEDDETAKIVLGFTDSLSAVLVENDVDEHNSAVLMPMRL